MSVTATVPVDTREWGGDPDPRLPIASWFRQFSILGDAGGGFMRIIFVFQEAAAPTLDGSMYSLEQLTGILAGVATDDLLVQTNGLGDSSGAQSWIVALLNHASTVTAPVIGRDSAFRGAFLGSVLAQGIEASLRFSTANINGGILNVTAEGYVWGSRSRSVLGGPKKPLGGLYAP